MIFDRAQLMLGGEAMERLAGARVILFGVGGVGSWCAESLVRTGVGHLTVVDNDLVSVTNVNRQMMATTETVGQVKVEALRNRLLQINPNADIVARREIFCETTAADFDLDSYDVIIDCIDSIADKALLILKATSTKRIFLSSMGAALKFDPTRIAVAEFWKVKGCPLARALRNRFKKEDRFPRRKFMCVYSDELLTNKGESVEGHLVSKGGSVGRANGSLMHITAIFGLTLAGLALQKLTQSV